MSSIDGIGNQSPVQKIIANPVHKQLAVDAPLVARGPDKLELSGMSHLLESLKSNDVRTDKVTQIRAQIEAGTYETPEKLDAAADKLLDELLDQ